MSAYASRKDHVSVYRPKGMEGHLTQSRRCSFVILVCARSSYEPKKRDLNAVNVSLGSSKAQLIRSCAILCGLYEAM